MKGGLLLPNSSTCLSFWEATKNTIAEYFKRGAFKEGIVAGILKAGQELKAHFPWNPNDTNELSNEISKG